MKRRDYVQRYLNGRYTLLYHVFTKHGICKILEHDISSHVLVVDGAPPACMINMWKIVHVHNVYVLLGQMLCQYSDGQEFTWFEMAFCQSKYMLKIWKDMQNAK